MKSIDRLRKYGSRFNNSHDAWSGIGTEILEFADEIEHDVDDMWHALTIDAKPMTDENMATDGWIRLPVDADGVSWHVGDMTDNGNVVNGMTIDFHGWHFTGTRNDIDPAIHRHYVPKPTVEDVLREFAEGLGVPVADSYIAAIAAKLRLAEDKLAEDNNCLYPWERDE